MTDSKIRHVTDTAIWVATYRAEESRRPDAAFQDPLAETLTGERGRQIVAELKSFNKIMSWIMVVRTTAIDALILKALTYGATAVVNLGTGLDTRPYRMNLPAELLWIEVDFPNIIEMKNEKLKNQKPSCRLERIAVDLSDDQIRRGLFARLAARSPRILVITEGVIHYLDRAQAEALSKDLFAIPEFKYWIQDYREGSNRNLPPKMREILKDTPFRFFEKDWLGFFKNHGWKIADLTYAVDESVRIKRAFPVIFPWTHLLKLMPRKVKQKIRVSSGCVLFQK